MKIWLALLLASCNSSGLPQPEDPNATQPSEQTNQQTEADVGISCGDKAMLAAYGKCVSAKSESACTSAGGHWGRAGFGPDSLCFCKTGQEGCACTRAADCLAGCTAPVSGSLNAPDPCAGAMFTCEGTGPGGFGCHCYIDKDGKAQSICVD